MVVVKVRTKKTMQQLIQFYGSFLMLIVLNEEINITFIIFYV